MVDYSELKNHLNDDVDCHYFESIPSTNDYLSSLAFSSKIQVCVTNQQTQGKGQHGRIWLSEKDSSVLLSIRKVFPNKVNLNGLSLVIGLALIEVLKNYGAADLKLKWPNDVYHQGKKLAGILIENSIQNSAQSTVIGIGININAGIECQTPWTDLQTITTQSVNLFELTKQVINQSLASCQLFESTGFKHFSQHWEAVNYLKNSRIYYQDKQRSFTGVCCGVNKEGVLLVQTKNTIEPIYSSEFLRLLQ